DRRRAQVLQPPGPARLRDLRELVGQLQGPGRRRAVRRRHRRPDLRRASRIVVVGDRMAKLEVESIQVVDAADVPRTGADLIAARLRDAIAARGTASIALSGGNTPRAIFQELAALPVDWQRVHVYFGDERCVPPDDPSSNFRMAREALFERVAVPNVHRM